jgi:hypothetical protein
MPTWPNLAPTNPTEWWTAIGAMATAASAILTVLAVFFAVRATRYAAQTVRIEQTPLLLLEHRHDDDSVVVRNLGRGIALNVVVTKEDGEFAASVSAIGPDQAVKIGTSGISFSLFEGQFIYGHDINGRWTRTCASYRGLRRSERNEFWNRVDGPIRQSRVPRKARRELRNVERSALEHLNAVTSYFTLEGWAHRRERVYVASRIGFFRWWQGVGEKRRVAKFSRRADTRPANAVPVEERAAWVLDVNGLLDCWKGPRIVNQLSCAWEGDTLVCEIHIRSGALPIEARGILAVRRSALEALPEDRAERNDKVRRRFDKYICGLRPQQRFAFVLRRLGPFVINDMF